MMNTPFTHVDIHDKTLLKFILLFGNADGFYITARYGLQHGFTVAGCCNANQAIELYIKAILSLDYIYPEKIHDVVKLLDKYKDKDNYFAELLKTSELKKFLKELSDAYVKFKYGEEGASSKSKEIIEILDRMAFDLRNIYFKKMGSPSTKIYVPKDARCDFLKDNQPFNETHLTNNPVVGMGLQIGFELPEGVWNA